MKDLSNLSIILEKLKAALNIGNIRLVQAILYALREDSKKIYQYLIKPKVSVFEKKKYMDRMKEICMKYSELISNNIQTISNVNMSILIETTGMLYKAGCIGIIDRIFEELFTLCKRNLDNLAYLADTLIECGCIDLAFKTLQYLLNKNYRNKPAVLINLAISSYMLGSPRKAKFYAEAYESLTRKTLTLKTSLQIVLGEVGNN